MEQNYTTALTIAGSDSSGGAGIQADLKTFAAFGCYGLSALTALTAQNTCGVQGSIPVPPEFVGRQLDALLDDIDIHAIKIGMLQSSQTITVISERLSRLQGVPIVLDTVLSSSGGTPLLNEQAIPILKNKLFPISTLITPNIPEATILCGRTQPLHTKEDIMQAARQLLELGPGAVLIKGGHMEGQTCEDLLVTNGKEEWFPADRIVTPNTHGTGCTLSSAITAGLARGNALSAAVREAGAYLRKALRAGSSLSLGRGTGPVHHFWNWWVPLQEEQRGSRPIE
ncbi:MAG: bifunctional hydroxymethylpyrimidine kinase/phosphomethylpyrimidine kinase [Prosthecochloris sp.]|nr:bifunctional hydroxymethylpyrimidine kinase/phosphomethylpyrimidine kinase [Prosthecochloris sp.]